MVLPLLGSFLGSAILPGMFTGLNPLAAGALGSGIGSLLQGDDFEDAIKTGLLSFMGGKLLGSLQKVPTTGPVDVSFGKTGNKLLGDPSAVNMSQIGETGLSTPKTPINIMDRLGSADTRKGLMSDIFGQGLATVKANPLAALGVAGGATLGSSMAMRKNDDDKSKSGLGLGIFIGKTLLERNGAKVICRNSKTRSGAEVLLTWKNKDLKNL